MDANKLLLNASEIVFEFELNLKFSLKSHWLPFKDLRIVLNFEFEEKNLEAFGTKYDL